MIQLVYVAEAMVEPVPVEPWDPMETVGSEAVQWWNAKLPGEVPPIQYWPLVDQQDLSDRYAPGDAGAEAASEAASEAANARVVKPYHIPQYPLPPSPQSAPPPVMPFANLDLTESTVMGISPPVSTISAPGQEDDGGESAGGGEGEGEEGGPAPPGLENDDVMDGSVGIPFESPPMKKDDAVKYGGEEAPGGSGVLGVDPKVFNRKDSPNTYCNYCLAAFGADIFTSGCASLPKRLQAMCEHVQTILNQQTDFVNLRVTGCVDKTGPVPVEHMPGPVEQRCPPLIGCNIIPSDSGYPMCGERLRAWGDFLPDVASSRKIRPDMPDVFQGPNFAPPPFLGAYEGNPYCELCSTIMNDLKVGDLQKDKIGREQAELVCNALPMSMRAVCADFVPKLVASPGFTDVVENGCVDVTKSAKGEALTPCPGLVACNAIASKGGRPMCGQMVGEWGFRVSDPRNPQKSEE